MAAIANGVFQRPGFMVIAWRVMSTPNGATRGGIDLGGTKIQAVVVDAAHVVLGQARHPTPTTGGPADVAAVMAAAMTEAASAAGVETDALAGVGVGSPGDVDAKAGTVTSARNLPDWEGEFALGAALEEALGTRLRLGNDVQVATDAEFALGAGRPYRSLLGVFWGTGVGGGIVLDGRPWTGRERGRRDRPRRRAHRRRALRAAGGAAAWRPTPAARRWSAGRARRTRRARRPTCSRSWSSAGAPGWRAASGTARSAQGDALATRARSTTPSRRSAPGVASAQNILDVEAIVIGGGLGVRLGDAYAKRIAEAMLPHLFDDDQPARDARSRRWAISAARSAPPCWPSPRPGAPSDSIIRPDRRSARTGGRRIIGRTRAFPCASRSSPTSTATGTPSRRCSRTSPPTDARELWCLGDVVGYGADPNDCCALAREHAAVVPRRQPRPRRHRRAPARRVLARRRARRALDAGGARRRPRRVAARAEPAGRRARASASTTPARATRSGSTCSARCSPSCASTPRSERVCLVGHSHVALSFVAPRGRGGDRRARAAAARRARLAVGEWLINPGSVGQPRDGDPRAAWLLLDTGAWHGRRGGGREYDIAGAAAAIRAARLPDSLAERLEYGQ